MSATASTIAPLMSLEVAVVGLARRLGWLVHYSHRRPAPGTDGGFPTLILARAKDERVIGALLLPDGSEPTIGESTWLRTLTAVGGIELVIWTPAILASGECERALR